MTIQQAFEAVLDQHRSGRLAEAEALLAEVLAVKLSDVEAWHRIVVTAYESGWPEAAVTLFRKVTNAGSESAMVLVNLGRAEEAIAAFRTAMQVKPGDSDLHNNLGLVLGRKGRPEDAAAFCRRAIELDPRNADAHLNLGITLGQSGCLGDGIAACRRSIELRQMLPLFRVREVEFISLQTDERAGQIRKLPGKQNIMDPSAHIGDLADTAALISELDLVNSIDTAVAHLAGALGKPVWVMLPFAADWRWMLGRKDSHWYPTMRLFRQRRPGQWDPVVAEVRDALRSFVPSRFRDFSQS